MPKPSSPPSPRWASISVRNTFHLVGLDKRGAIVLRERLSRAQVEVRLANMAPCLVGMESCVGAHHLGRRVAALGHDVRLIAAKYVHPFCRKQKNDGLNHWIAALMFSRRGLREERSKAWRNGLHGAFETW